MNIIYIFSSAKDKCNTVIDAVNKALESNSDQPYTEVHSVSSLSEIRRIINCSLFVAQPEYQCEGVNGIQAACEMRRISRECEIAFVSSSYSYLPEILENRIRPLAYFIFPVDDKKIAMLFDDVFEKEQYEQESESIVLINSYKRKQVPISSILFFTAESKKVVCVTEKKGKIIFYDTMKSLEKRLSQAFLRCHVGFLVNRNKILSISEDCTCIRIKDTEIAIPISRKYRKTVAAEFGR